jgi:hypothetical protein
MRTSPAASLATAARLPRALLLALALCACGGDGGGGETEGADAPGAAPQASLEAARDTSCPAPPAIDPALFTGSWSALVDSLTARGASFPVIEGNHSVANLRLCQDCDTVNVALRADTTTYCTRREQLADGQTRIMGIMVLREPFAAQHGWNNLKLHDSIFMFASDTAGYATMVYRNGDNATTAPDSSWAFYYCPDGERGTRPRSHWRARNKPFPAQPPGADEVVDFEEEGGSYGWMACASGCCQFYTPPPNPIAPGAELPDRANEKARDAVDKNRNTEPGASPFRPSWCTA